MYYKGKSTILKKEFSPINLLFFGLGNILGPQIFIMLAGLIAIADIYGIFTLIICSLICYLIAMAYLELAMCMPVVGVVVNSVNDAFGAFTSFLVGWSQVFSNISFAAVCAIGFGMFLGKPLIGAIIIVIIVSILELKGISGIEKIDKLLVISMLGFFAVIFVANISNLSAITQLSFSFAEQSNLRKILLGMGFFFLAFTNFEDLTTYAEEMQDIKKLPRVMFSTVTIVSILFILIYLVLIGAIGSHSASLEAPLEFLSSKVFGSISLYIITIIGMIASISSLMGSLSSSSRNIFSLAEIGFLPKKLRSITAQGIPINAIGLATLFALMIILSGGLELVIYLANFIYFFVTFFVCITVIKLRGKRKKLERPFKIPLFPIPPLVTAVAVISLMFFLEMQSIGLGLVWIFVGFIIYILRIVGEFRLKLAIFGATIITWVIIIIAFLILRESVPNATFALIPVFIASQILFIVFSYLQILDIKEFRKKIADN
ncbi:amino acid permease [Candidatus Woesearchaeota archaeon]|nr:amino acid permease [Candidatus Woesearchaeota archaeon]